MSRSRGVSPSLSPLPPTRAPPRLPRFVSVRPSQVAHDLRGDYTESRSEYEVLRGEFENLRSKLSSMRQKMDAPVDLWFQQSRRGMQQLVEIVQDGTERAAALSARLDEAKGDAARAHAAETTLASRCSELTYTLSERDQRQLLLASENDALKQKHAAEARAAEVLREDLQRQVSSGNADVATGDARYKATFAELHRVKSELSVERSTHAETKKTEAAAKMASESELRAALSEKRGLRDDLENATTQVSVLLCTVTFCANLAHSLTRSP